MEDIDIDSIFEIPDTPDRLSTQHMNRGNYGEKGCNLAVAGHLGRQKAAGEESMDWLRGSGRLAAENGHNRKHYPHTQRHLRNVDETEHHKSTIVISPLGKDQQNAPLFRKVAMERGRNSIREQDMDKGKAPFFKLPSKSSVSREHHAILDLTEQNTPQQMVEMASQQGESKVRLAEGRRDGHLPRNGGSYLRNASNSTAASRNSCKGKEKIDDIGFKSSGPVMDGGKGMGLPNGCPLRMEKQLPASHHSSGSPRPIRQKRLVRNGCISPQNIAIRAKQLSEQSKASSKDEQNLDNLVSNDPCRAEISHIIAEDKNYSKGKGVVHPHISKKHETNFINLCSSPLSNNGVASGIGDSSIDPSFEEQDGWRSTHNRSKNVDYLTLHHVSRFNNGCQEQNKDRVVIRDNTRGENSSSGCDCPENPDATETASVPISEPSRATDLLPKRQKKRVSTSRSNVQSSRLISNDSDIVFLGSSSESSSSMSTSTHIGQPLEVMDLESLDMRGTSANNMECVNDQDSDARARQVEADELLARELQEQLYHEMPIFGNGEMYEEMAWAFQREEDTIRPTSVQNHEPAHRGSTRHSHIQPSSRTSQNSSNRRVQARLSTSARMSRLRSQVMNQPPIARSRTRNFRFPLGMDLDMRLDILEAMEAAFGEADDIGMSNHIFQVQRDFNENDYEMLLALDEDNHRHGGASTNQINSLPLSKVQTDNYDEACAICLETPTIGETIRHLPCLHKFHKDCIDPWLSRKTSCPVCKSSIN